MIFAQISLSHPGVAGFLRCTQHVGADLWPKPGPKPINLCDFRRSGTPPFESGRNFAKQNCEPTNT